MKASIKKNPNGSVTLSHDSPFGRVERTFYTHGSYVYEGDHQQVCDGLSSRGWTLHATPDLAGLIRSQWRKMRDSYKKHGFI